MDTMATRNDAHDNAPGTGQHDAPTPAEQRTLCAVFGAPDTDTCDVCTAHDTCTVRAPVDAYTTYDQLCAFFATHRADVPRDTAMECRDACYHVFDFTCDTCGQRDGCDAYDAGNTHNARAWAHAYSVELDAMIDRVTRTPWYARTVAYHTPMDGAR